MKLLRLAVLAAFALVSGRAYAFHAGGVAQCEGCHTMHNSKTTTTGTASTAMFGSAGIGNPTIGVASAYLLQGRDPSSTCLGCHGPTDTGSYHIYSPTLASTTTAAFTAAIVNYTPGGDFGWQANTNFNNSKGGNVHRLGHSVVAAEFTGMTADSRKTAPSGKDAVVYDGEAFSCVSCHDPHGKTRLKTDGTFATTGEAIWTSGSYGSTATTNTEGSFAVGAYRLLGGAGYKAKSSPTMTAFANPPPVAVAPKTYSVSETAATRAADGKITNQVVVAYGQGMSEWCKNCHPGLHNDTDLTSGAIFRHPAGNGAKLTNVYAAYNSYVESGVTNGTNVYDALVPVEVGTSTIATLAGMAQQSGTGFTVTGSNNVMCLSCHRAHASAFDFALRWKDAEFAIEDGGYYGVEAGSRGEWRSAAILQAGFQNRPAATYSAFQKSLCNKCHVKD